MRKYFIMSLTAALLISGFAFYMTFSEKAEADTRVKYGSEAKEEMQAMMKKIDEEEALKQKFSEQFKNNEGKIKTVELLDRVWEDIKETNAIDQSNYTKFNYLDLSDNTPDEVKNIISDKDISIIIHEFMCSMPSKTTIPVILVSKDKKEIIFASKSIDGTNIVFKAVNNNGNWEKSESRNQGKVITMQR